MITQWGSHSFFFFLVSKLTWVKWYWHSSFNVTLPHERFDCYVAATWVVFGGKKKHIILQCFDAIILAQQGKSREPVACFSVWALSGFHEISDRNIRKLTKVNLSIHSLFHSPAFPFTSWRKESCNCAKVKENSKKDWTVVVLFFFFHFCCSKLLFSLAFIVKRKGKNTPG